MDDRWRVMHALPGDGQNRPSVGDSLVQIQERYNTLSNIQAETFPRLKSQQRAVVQQLMASSDPMIQQALADPSNIGFVKGVLGLSDLVVPGEDSRNKQLREIDLLLVGQASSMSGVDQEKSEDGSGMSAAPPSGIGATPQSAIGAAHHVGKATGYKPVLLVPSVPIDLLFDNHVVELEECRRWANSDAGQVARIENPAGFANVRAHAEAHLRAIGLAYAGQNSGAAKTPPPTNNSPS
jgi:hypothetical protein